MTSMNEWIYTIDNADNDRKLGVNTMTKVKNQWHYFRQNLSSGTEYISECFERITM